MKKFYLLILASFIIIFLGSVALASSCNCFSYEMPFQYYQRSPDKLVTYYRDEGLIRILDLKNYSVSNIQGTEDLGSFIRKIVWSPEGDKALFLAENILPAKRTLKLYSSDREPDSLNWWVYNLESKDAKLLPEGLISVGWLDENTLIANQENKSVVKISLNGSDSRQEIVTDIKGKNSLEDNLFPFLLNEKIIFPHENGFYVIDKLSGKAEFFASGEKLISASPNSYLEERFVVETEKGALVYHETGKLEIETGELFKHPIFISENDLLGVKNDGYVYYFWINEKKFERFSQFKLMDPEYLFFAGNDKKIIAITSEGGLYYLQNGEEKRMDDSSNRNLDSTDNNQKMSVDGNYDLWVLVAAISVGIISSILYIKWKIKK